MTEINEEEYEAMKTLVMKHNSRINILYRLVSLSEIVILLVLIISFYLIYNDVSFKFAAVLFVVFFVVLFCASYMIQRNRI